MRQRVTAPVQKPFDEIATIRGLNSAIRTSERPRLSIKEFGIHRVITSFVGNFNLVLQLTQREVAMRYKGSLLGMAWSFVTPLLMLTIYTFVFSVIFQARWEVRVESREQFALILFTGLIVFYIFSECIGRAPSLLNENPSYVKRVVFPLEALAWVLVLSATFNAVVSFGILLLAHLVMVGLPPVTIIWLPLILLPFVIMMTGVVWFLSSTGLYVRDIRQLVGVIIPILMFISPVFYPTSALPVGMQRYMYLNPLAFMIEQVRNVALFGIAPNLAGLALFTVLSVIVAWAGLVWLLLTKRGFADVI